MPYLRSDRDRSHLLPWLLVGALLPLLLALAATALEGSTPMEWFVNCDGPSCADLDLLSGGSCVVQCPAECVDEECPEACICPHNCVQGDPGCPVGCTGRCPTGCILGLPGCDDCCPDFCPASGTEERPFNSVAAAQVFTTFGDTVFVLPTDDDPDRIRPECDAADAAFDPAACPACDPMGADFAPECCPEEPAFDLAACCGNPDTADSCEPRACHENVTMVSGVDLVSTEGPERTTILAELTDSPVVVASNLTFGTRLEGFTITGGGGRLGGGIQALFGAPTITNNVIEGNVTQGTELVEARGGGIYLYLASGEISDNIIRNNVAGNPDFQDAPMEIQSGGNGGGIFSFLGSPQITRNIVSGNAALASPDAFSEYVFGYGGGMSVEYGASRVTDNLIVGNLAGLGGGGIDTLGGSPQIINNTVDGNCAGIGSILPADCGTLGFPTEPTGILFGVGGGIHLLNTVIPTVFNNLITNNAAYDVGGGLNVYSVYPGPRLPSLRLQANLFLGNDAFGAETADPLSPLFHASDEIGGLRLCTEDAPENPGDPCEDDADCMESGGGGEFTFCVDGPGILDPAREVGDNLIDDPMYLNPPPLRTPCDPTDVLDCDFHLDAASPARDTFGPPHGPGRDVIRECGDGPDEDDVPNVSGSGPLACSGDDDLTFTLSVSLEDLDRNPRTIRFSNAPEDRYQGTDLGAYEFGFGDPDDTDSDGILDDGDGSGTPGDLPCPDQTTVGCDDNCPAVVNGGQVDSDDDGLGDVCDACPFTADPDQDDLDGDGQGNLCDPDQDDDQVLEDNGPVCADQVTVDCSDSCPEIATPSQFDSDDDGVGDSCDCAPLDELVVEPADEVGDTLVFAAASSTQLEWADIPTADSYELYRASLAELKLNWTYTQDPLVVAGAAQFCDVIEPTLEDTFQPEPGLPVYYLVVSVNACGGTSLGEDSAGEPRPNFFPCF